MLPSTVSEETPSFLPGWTRGCHVSGNEILAGVKPSLYKLQPVLFFIALPSHSQLSEIPGVSSPGNFLGFCGSNHFSSPNGFQSREVLNWSHSLWFVYLSSSKILLTSALVIVTSSILLSLRTNTFSCSLSRVSRRKEDKSMYLSCGVQQGATTLF